MLRTSQSLFIASALLATACTTNDVDLVPLAQIQATASVVPEAGGSLDVVVTLDAAASKAVTVELEFSGSATSDDYQVSATTVVIPAGSLSGSVSVTTVDDSDVEGSEFVEVRMAGVTNALADANSIAAFTIDDDDQAGPSVV
ncbi:MAG: hypothetical protein RL738_690, partial [Bacteroidota bacterium]